MVLALGDRGGERASAADSCENILSQDVRQRPSSANWAASMAKASRSNDWGFPRWRAYGSARDAEPVRHCDRHGCDAPGDKPAPKSPNSPERWYFCERHAAEYNRNWNYFEGLSAEDAAARETDEQRDANAFRQANHYGW